MFCASDMLLFTTSWHSFDPLFWHDTNDTPASCSNYTPQPCPRPYTQCVTSLPTLQTDYRDGPSYLTSSCPCSSSTSEGATVIRWMTDCRLQGLKLTARKMSSSIQVRKLSRSGFTSSSSMFSNCILFQIFKNIHDKNKALTHWTLKPFLIKEKYSQLLIP